MRPGLNKLLTVLAFIFLLGSLIYLGFTFTSFQKAAAPSEVAIDSSNSSSPAGDYYTGLVEKLMTPVDSLATHRLVDENGKVIAYLESRQIDLSILEGFRASIHGVKERILNDGIPIVQVDKVSFK
ncbi:MAG: hypothetical protein M1352_03240 [Patescibacteria group bacterium]|nr:hypothetical protein [Patescibacteria group bacterium]